MIRWVYSMLWGGSLGFELPKDLVEVVVMKLGLTECQHAALDSVVDNPNLVFGEDVGGVWTTKLLEESSGLVHWNTWNALQSLEKRRLVRRMKRGRDLYWWPVMEELQRVYVMPFQAAEQLALFA